MLLREGVALLLGQAGLEVAAQVDSADALVEAVGEHDPAVALVDMRMPPTHTDEGLQAARRFERRETPVTTTTR